MIPGLFDDRAARTLRTALNGLQLRQQTIAANIANVDTPEYKAQTVQFEEQLAAELAAPAPRQPELMRLGLSSTHQMHIPLTPRLRTFEATPAVKESLDGTLRNDGNTVDVEREMALLAETQISYNALAQIVAGKFGTLRSAINEGRR